MFFSYSDIVNACSVEALTREMSIAFSTNIKALSTTAEKTLIYNDHQQDEGFISMPVLDRLHELYINKVGSIFARNQGDTLPTIHAQVLAFCGRTGKPLAILDGKAVTNLKCAAISAYVTDMCAKSDAQILAVIGAGQQARQQIKAVLTVRDIQKIKLYNRSSEALHTFRQEILSDYPFIKVEVCSSIAKTIDHADIVGTATSSRVPIDLFRDLKPDIHINCMGGHSCSAREIPQEVLEHSFLIVEDRETAVVEAGALHQNATEVFELHLQDRSKLQSQQTIFSSTGYALLDAITVAKILKLTGKNENNAYGNKENISVSNSIA
ncbi:MULTISPECIES: ornithine cyclodeaminase family protein [Cysteiniphilum]|uniref:Ornithine cyclodeaminase n=1 Tax=Cysteiniphilum litorale TaxID=2056700 RepID=A0A8J2Z6L6_9GAMM|nr:MULTISPECIES: ornithine cyclodeaminase family protein [Cysteiniphilum]GGG05584.1 ornithine cyclodeaminase [Cysteiniphilum litorale]